MAERADPAKKPLGPSTLSVHGGEARPKPEHSLATPIVQTATFTWANTQELKDHFDGKIDRRSAAGEKGTQVQEADTNGDGKIDTWITKDASGQVTKKEEDRNGDGKPDLTAWFEGGKIKRLEQDTKGKGCIDLRQWFDAREKVSVEYSDTNGDCKTDVWSFFENEVLVRQGLDTNGDGRPDALNQLDAQGKVRVQEVASGEHGPNPDKRMFLDESGQVVAQCLLGEKKDTLDTRAIVKGGVFVKRAL